MTAINEMLAATAEESKLNDSCTYNFLLRAEGKHLEKI